MKEVTRAGKKKSQRKKGNPPDVNFVVKMLERDKSLTFGTKSKSEVSYFDVGTER